VLSTTPTRSSSSRAPLPTTRPSAFLRRPPHCPEARRRPLPAAPSTTLAPASSPTAHLPGTWRWRSRIHKCPAIQRARGADAFGGALCNAAGTALAFNSTFALNAAQGGAAATNGIGYGGGICSSSGTASLLNTIVANSLSGSNAFGILTDLGHNLSSDASCNFSGPGSLNNTDPILAPLDDYGGPTPTMALLAGSPAIDGGDPARIRPPISAVTRGPSARRPTSARLNRLRPIVFMEPSREARFGTK